jgi:hypothetical protein
MIPFDYTPVNETALSFSCAKEQPKHTPEELAKIRRFPPGHSARIEQLNYFNPSVNRRVEK